MAVYDEEKLYNELMNGAPSAEQSTATQNSAAALKEGEGYAAPGEYTGGIADRKLDEAINKYLNSRGFNYNTADDPDYQAYVREYNENAKQGRALSRATAKTLANGYNPTYADTVSDEVYNSYMENVTDAVPQFKNLAAMENSGRENQLANAVNIYSTQAQKDYGRYRDTVGDKKNFLNYLYDRYATDRQSDVQQNADKASIYSTRLSSAQSNLENARSIDNQRYLYNTQSADNRAQLAQQERENQQKIEYQKAEDAYNAKVESTKKQAKEEQQNNDNRYERDLKDYIEAYNLENAKYDYVTNQLAISYGKGVLTKGEVEYLTRKLKVNMDDVQNRQIYGKRNRTAETGGNNMAVKKRTLGDDLRDFKAGKAPDGYRDNIKNTTPYAIKSWQRSDGFVGGEGSADNPIYGDNSEEINASNSQNTLGNTAKTNSSNNKKSEEKKKPVIKNTNEFAKFGQNAFENPKQGIKSEKDEKKQQYILDLDNSGGLPSSEEISAFGNAALSPVGKITTEADKYREYENEYKDYSYDQFKSEAEKVDDKADNGWKKKWFDSAIVEKRNEFYSDKYKDHDYKKLKTESSNNKLPDEEREWLKNSADEKATSKDLQGELDSLEAEYKELLKSSEEDHTTSERKTITDRLDFIEKRRPKLQNLIEKKIQEENEKKYYYDIVENDVKAATVIQKYYKLNKFNKNGTSDKSANADEAVKYPEMGEKSQDERTKIEQDFYNLEKKGYDTEKLLKYYSRIKEREEAEEDLEYLRNQADKYPISSSFGSMIMNTYGSIPDTVNYIGAGIDKAFGGDGYINPDSTNVAKAQTIREKVSEDMDGLGKFFYSTTMSIGDNLARLPLLALPGGEAMSLALAGTSAGVSSANDVINSGGSLESALWTGAAAGTAEVVFEKIPLDNLIKLKNEGTDSVFRAVVNQMKTEGLEEVGTEIANAIIDQIINGDMSQLALQYQNYIAQGYSEDEAWKMTAGYFASQLGQSFAAGAISGGVLSGGTVAINKIGGTIEEKSEKRQSVSQLGREALQSENFNVNELIKSAKKSDNPKAVNLANSLEKVVEEKGADKVKAVDVGNLLTLTNSDEITYDYSEDLSELTGTDKQNIIDSNFELNGEEKTSKTSDGEVKYTDTKAFGENYPHGLGAKISKTGERITIVGLKSSSKDFNSDDNTVVLLADNGELYDSDDIRTSVSHFNDLFDYAKNFDTIGARVFLSQYEDYAKRSKSRGKTADIAEYSECFERLYSYGVKGVTYDSIKKSGNFTREINILSAGVAYSAVQSGNNDFKVDTRNKSNKSQKIRMPGESNSISSKVYVDPGSEDSVKVTDEQLAILQAVADKTCREIVLTDRMGERTGDENANGGYNPNDGKIYINAEVHDSYMLSVSLHEAVHGVASDNPAEYHALCTFITNYLVAKGENIDNLLDDIKVKWGDSVRSEDAALEELVCQTVMAIATDEAAIKTALSLEENKGILQKVASALKKIAKAAYDFIKGVGIQAHNKQAQPWIDNIEALNELATRLEKAFESTRKLNEQRASTAENTEKEQKNNTHSDVKFSYGGPTAKTAKISLFVQAIEMENSGKNSEYIRQKTGWFRGMDGKWRFEIDDSKMRFYKATKQDIKNTEDYKNNKIRYNGLSHKIANNTATAEQQQKFKAAEKYIKEYETSKKLSDYVSHPELFRAYPQLKEVNFYFDTISAKGAYYPDNNAIVINPTLSQAEQRESIIHEIQHAIQHIEGFADGSTMAQWQKNGADSLTAYNNYINTAGEIEARDTASRINLNSEQRKNTRPDIDRKDVVFIDSDKVSFSYNVTQDEINHYVEKAITKENTQDYKKYAKVSQKLMKDVSSEIDLKGYSHALRDNDIRHIFNSHGEITNEKYPITAKDVELIPYIIENYDKVYYYPKGNKKGLLYVKVSKDGVVYYVEQITTQYGNEKLLINKQMIKTGINDIPDIGEMESVILKKQSKSEFLADLKARQVYAQSVYHSYSANTSLQQNNNNVKHSVDDSIDNKYLEAVKNNDLETAQKLVNEAAKENGYTIKAYHGTTNQQEKSTWNDKMKWYDTEYKHFTVFKRQYDEQAGHFFNDDIDNAGGYGSILYSVYLKINKPLVIDCNGQNYASITFDGKEMDTYEWAEYAKKHRYDGVIFKNISDGVGYDDLSRLTTDYVVFESNQIKSSEPITYDDKGNVIPLSKRFNYLVDIRYSKDDTIDSDDKKITAGMSDSERAEILNNKSIEKVIFDYDKAKDFDLDYIENNIKSIVEKPLLEKLGKLGTFKNYKANDIDIDFSFTRNGMKKSLHSQEIYYGGSKSDLVKIILSLDELLDKAVLIESHFDKAKGTPKENKRLKQVFVLLSVLEDKNNTIPVQFEIKQFVDNNNRLYLAVALTSFKTEKGDKRQGEYGTRNESSGDRARLISKEEISVKANTAQEKNQVRTKLGLSPEISIPELISKINIRDRNFLKYIPNVLLTKEQINAKNLAIEEENKKYGRTDYYDEDFSDISEIKLAVDDTIIDYLAEEYGKPKSRADYQKIIEENPNAAILMMYRNSIETAQKGLFLSESIKLPEESYRKIARKVLIDMGVKVNNYGSAVGRLAESIKHIVEKTEEVAKARVVSGPGYFRNLFENFAKACSDYVKLSSRYNENYRKNVRDYVNGLISNNVLVVRDDDIELIKKNYGSVTEFRSRMNGKTKVGMAKNGRTGYYIEDVADWVYKKYPKLVKATRDKDGVWHWPDKDGGFRWFDMLVNDYLEPKLDTRVESSTVKGYYEDRQSAGFEAALNAINCVLREKVKVGVNEKRIERSLVKELDNEAEQSANELKELKWAKYRIEELRKRNRKLNAELNKGMSAIREEYYEARMKTVERNKLIRKLNKFIKLFENGKSSKNYVPDVLQKPILDVLKMIEMNAGTYKNGKQKAAPKSFDRYTQKVSDIDRAVTELTEKYETLKEKQVSYSSDVEFSLFDINTLGFEEETLEMLKTLQEQVKGKNIYELSAEDLRTIYDTINELDGALKRAVEVIIDGQKTTVQEAALKAVEEIGGLKVKKGGSGIKGTVQMLSNQTAISSLDPERFSRYISGYHDDYVIRKIINELHNGEKKVQRIKQAGYIKVTSVLSKFSNKDVKLLQKGDVVEFDFIDIDTNKRVKVSPSMLMGIFLTVKQEDGLRHIINDDPNRYLSLPDLELLNKNNPISDLRQDNRRAVESERHRVRLTEDDISHINNYIETNAMLKELCNAIMIVFNDQIATEINYVSLQTQGRKIAVVKNYYPLSVDPDCPKCKSEWEFTSVFKDQRIKNKGFTKNRTYSTLPLRIDDAMSVFSKHISETAEYCGLLIPLTNFMKIYRNGSDTDTVKSIIKKTYGEPAIHYINKFIGDLQKSDNTDNNLFLKWQGKYMGAKLLANPGAMIQQFSAFPLANKYFGTKNVAAAATVGFNKIDFALYAKYTPYLWYRAQGNGTILGEVSKEVGFYKKLTDYLDIMGKVDRLVVGRLLYAAELHVEQTTDLKRGTDAFYKEVVRQFEKCIDETQPNNMVTSKPQFIRNNIMKALSFSAFRSQVMAVGNCIIDSFGEYNARRSEYNEIKTDKAKAAKKEAAKNFLKVLIGAANSFVIGAILKCIADIILRHKYDDIKDEKGNITFANIAWKFADESLENLASSFIWGDKLYEIGATMIDHDRYFGLDVMSVEAVNDGVEKAKKGDWFAIAALLIDGFGYPAENMLRYGRSILAYANDISNGYGEIITKNNSTENNTSYFNFIIVEAKHKGETEKAEHFEQLWKDDLINKQGKTEEQANDTIKTKLVTALAASDDDVEQAALAKANGDLKSYEEHMNKVVAYGFDSVDVKKAVDKVIKNVADDIKNRGLEEKSDIISDLKNQGFNDKGAEYVYKSMQSGESSESEEELSAFSDTSEGEGVAYTYSDAFEYLKNGDRENYERIEQYLIDNTDKTKKDVQSAMRSASRTDELWKAYFEAQGTLSGGGDPVKLEELKKILTNIYGSWSTATTYGRKYKERMKKKEREKNK